MNPDLHTELGVDNKEGGKRKGINSVTGEFGLG